MLCSEDSVAALAQPLHSVGHNLWQHPGQPDPSSGSHHPFHIVASGRHQPLGWLSSSMKQPFGGYGLCLSASSCTAAPAHGWGATAPATMHCASPAAAVLLHPLPAPPPVCCHIAPRQHHHGQLAGHACMLCGHGEVGGQLSGSRAHGQCSSFAAQAVCRKAGPDFWALIRAVHRDKAHMLCMPQEKGVGDRLGSQ